MLPSEIVYRTFHIAYGDGEGTAFAFDHDGKQYLITAQHVVKGLEGSSRIEIWHDGEWKLLDVTLVGHADVDVSVLSAAHLLADPGFVLEPALGGWYIGQDAYFVGFPLGMKGLKFDSPFPIPLLKRATISGKIDNGTSAPYFLDAINNQGFSGAPVYLKIPGEKTFKVAMIVASFTAIEEPVCDEDGNPTGMFVLQNSGIMAAFAINVAMALIEANPIGFPLRASQ